MSDEKEKFSQNQYKLALNLDEAAASCGLSKRTLTRANQRGLLPFVRFSRRPLVRAEVLAAFLKSSEDAI